MSPFAKASAQGLTHNSGVQELMVNGGLRAHPSSGVVPTVLPDSIAGLAEQRKEEATAVTVAQVTNLSCADSFHPLRCVVAGVLAAGTSAATRT
jgi:hypothetical protein